MALAPNPAENLYIGRGVLYFDRFGTGDTSTGELDLGEASNLSLSLDTTTKEHTSKRSGLAVTTKSIIDKLTTGGTFTLDEYSRENLTLALFGSSAKLDQTATSVSNEEVFVRKGRWVKLRKRNVSSVVIQGKTINTDYKVDGPTGRIYFNDVAGWTEAQTITVDYSAGTTALDTVRAFTVSEVRGSMRFISSNASGPDYELEIWKCSIKPAGNIDFLSDDWGKIQFNVSIEKDETNHPNEPYFRLIER